MNYAITLRVETFCQASYISQVYCDKLCREENSSKHLFFFLLHLYQSKSEDSSALSTSIQQSVLPQTQLMLAGGQIAGVSGLLTR